MRLSNEIIMGAAWLFHYLNPPVLDADKIYAHAKKHNEGQVFKMPKDRKFNYQDLKNQTD